MHMHLRLVTQIGELSERFLVGPRQSFRHLAISNAQAAV